MCVRAAYYIYKGCTHAQHTYTFFWSAEEILLLRRENHFQGPHGMMCFCTEVSQQNTTVCLVGTGGSAADGMYSMIHDVLQELDIHVNNTFPGRARTHTGMIKSLSHNYMIKVKQ